MQIISRIVTGGLLLVMLSLYFFMPVFTSLAVAAEKKDIHVLIVVPFPYDYPVCEAYIKGIRSRLQQETNYTIRYTYEYLDLLHFTNPEKYLADTAQYFQLKYADWQPDIIIASSALDSFFKQYGSQLFPGVPVVMEWSEISLPAGERPPGLITAAGTLEFPKTIDVILQTKPATKNLYIIIGSSPEEQRYYEKLAALAQAYQPQTKFTFLHDLSYNDMMTTATQITDDNAAILFVRWASDSKGKTYIPLEVLKELCAQAKIPIYATNAQFLGTGIIGGYLYNYEIVGRNIAEVVLAYLHEHPVTPPSRIAVPNCEYAFDARALARWQIDTRQLPPESRIAFSDQSIWTQYKPFILLGIIAFLLETALICLALRGWYQQRKSRQALMQTNHTLEQRNQQLHTAQEMLKQLNEKLALSAQTDLLTGLYNRRHIEKILQQTYTQYQKTGQPFAIIMADIDFFKKINDTYGHDAGDTILRLLAADLRTLLRENDTPARWGGEEFLFVLPNVQFAETREIAEQLCHTISERRYLYQENQITVTLTLGFALCQATDSIDSLIKRADTALYQGKNTGRNRVVCIDQQE